MFDTVKVEIELMGLPVGSYQTKSLANVMETYRLSSDGRLIFLKGHKEETGETHHFFGTEIETQKFVLDELVDTNYHGWITIYGNTLIDVEKGGFVDFKLKFTDGKLVEVKRENNIFLTEGD
tara:strand:+ start:5209 stop:5574 length:366 start_codon:yes stop_codon:yes gene_type:complete